MAAEQPALIDEALASFLAGPVSGFLGTADTLGTPDASRIVGVRAIDGSHLHILISAQAETARRNATVGARVAVLITDITNYRSVEWKGRIEATGQSRSPGDTALIDHHIRTFKQASPVVGLDPEDVWRIFPLDGVPLVVAVDEIFDQTPGRNAGHAMKTPS